MSVEEDVELRDLVAQTLESNGCLAKIRAQLRASIFLALDEDIEVASKQPLMNNKIKTHLESPEGKTMFCLVREFLEYFNLCYTISVYDAESYLSSQYKFEGRQKLIEDLELEAIEDTTVPVLLQLIKIAQMKTKGIEIKMNVNGSQAQHDKSLSQGNESDSNIKTDESNSDTQTEDKSSDDILPNNAIKDGKLNTTFDVNSPIFRINKNIEVNGDTSNNSNKVSSNHLENNENGNTLDTTYNKIEKKDDTYEDTSSFNEDSISTDNNLKAPEISNGVSEDISLSKSSDKSKLSPQKSDKVKSKINLSSLSDLPPLQINKSRGTDILPSLYSKEFKEKSNLRELDKLFDMEVEYEEDFMCSGDELSLKSDYLKSDSVKLSLVDEHNSIKSPISEKSSAMSIKEVKRSKSPTRLISDCNKPLFKTLSGNQKEKDTSNDCKSESGGSSSVSENIDLRTSE